MDPSILKEVKRMARSGLIIQVASTPKPKVRLTNQHPSSNAAPRDKAAMRTKGVVIAMPSDASPTIAAARWPPTPTWRTGTSSSIYWHCFMLGRQTLLEERCSRTIPARKALAEGCSGEGPPMVMSGGSQEESRVEREERVLCIAYLESSQEVFFYRHSRFGKW